MRSVSGTPRGFGSPARTQILTLAVIAFRQMSFKKYTDELRRHYESFYGVGSNKLTWDKGPTRKLHPEFFILEFGPSERHQMWTYATIGMSLDRDDENLIELITYSKGRDKSRVELLTVIASFHRNSVPLNLHHTVFVGQLTDSDTTCDYGFISLPYIEGEDLEKFLFGDQEIHSYWFIPITEKERDLKIEKGCDALENLFEAKQFDYLDMQRKSLV
jgi:hypothetical protein